jgi:RHS repeat-associated protein
VGSATTDYSTDADSREVLEYNGASGSGALLLWYAFGRGPDEVLNQMSVSGSGTRATLIPDIQGSLIGSLDAATGTLKKTGYQPFGQNASVTPSTQPGFYYTGRRLDPETAGSTAQPSGLYYYRARMYAPGWGRFLQPDPIAYAGGPNLYAYVNNDPLNLVDPLGLWTLQVGFSFYFTWGRLGGQFGLGLVADTAGNLGYYYTGGVGPGAGGALKAAVSAAGSGAPTIIDLRGLGQGISAVAGVPGTGGLGGSVDVSKGQSNGTVFKSIGGSIGFAAGAGISAGPSLTGVICVLGPDCGSPVQSVPNGAAPLESGPSSSSTPTLAPTNQGGGSLGGAAGS